MLWLREEQTSHPCHARVRIRIAAILLCLLLALTLAGCVHADRTITFNSDGTGTYTYAIGLSAQMISLGGSTLTQSMDKFGDTDQTGRRNV